MFYNKRHRHRSPTRLKNKLSAYPTPQCIFQRIKANSPAGSGQKFLGRGLKIPSTGSAALSDAKWGIYGCKIAFLHITNLSLLSTQAVTGILALTP